MTKKIFKIIGFVFLAIVILAGALLAWLSIAEYKPADVEDAQTSFISGSAPISADKDITVLTWNIGYSGLGAGSDFFMDGGENVKSADKDTVNKYLTGISKTIKDSGADVCMLQEVDENSSRSYNINEKNILAEGLNNAYALNYSCPFERSGFIRAYIFTSPAFFGDLQTLSNSWQNVILLFMRVLVFRLWRLCIFLCR